MVVAISIFDTLAFLSSASLNGISRNICTHTYTHTHTHEPQKNVQTNTHTFTRPKDYVQFNIDAIRQTLCRKGYSFASVNRKKWKSNISEA